MQLKSLVIIAALVPCLHGEASAQSQTDAKLWAGFTGEVELTRQLRLDIEEELRLGDSFTGFDKTFTQLGLRYRINKFLRVSGHYRFIVTQDDFGSAEIQNRGAGDIELRYGMGKWRADYRLRLQSTVRPDNTRTYVRNKLKGSYRLDKKLAPFAGVEVFYLTTKSEFREFRVYLGSGWQINRKMGLSVFYMYQNEFNTGDPEQNHILGVGMSYRFRDIRGGGKKKKQKKKKKKKKDKDTVDAG